MERNKLHKSFFSRSSGFTLIELLVSAFIFLFAIGAALATFHSASQLSETARNRMVALHDASAVLEEVKAVQLSQISTIVPTQFRSQILDDNNQLVNALDNENIVLTTNPAVIDGATTLATVTVTVTWEDVGGRPFTLSMTTQKSGY